MQRNNNKASIIAWILAIAILVSIPLLSTRDYSEIKQLEGVSQGFTYRSKGDDYVEIGDIRYYFDQGTPVDSDQLEQLLVEGANVKIDYIPDGRIVVSLTVEGQQIYTQQQYAEDFERYRTETPLLILAVCAVCGVLIFGLTKVLGKSLEKQQAIAEETKKRPLSEFDKFEIAQPKALAVVFGIFAFIGIALLVMMVVLQILQIAGDAFVPLLVVGIFFGALGIVGFIASKREKFTLQDGVYTYVKLFGQQSVAVENIAFVEIDGNFSSGMTKIIFWDVDGKKAISFMDGGMAMRSGEFEQSMKLAKIPNCFSINYKTDKAHKEMKDAMVALWLKSADVATIFASGPRVLLQNGLNTIGISLEKGVYKIGWYKDNYTQEQYDAMTEEQLEAVEDEEPQVLEEHQFDDFLVAFACVELIWEKILG